MRTTILLVLAAAAGCGGGLRPQGTFQTGGQSETLAFTQLTQTGYDLAAGSKSRGVVDLISQAADKSWSVVGSFFAGGLVEEVAGGKVDKRGVVAVRDDLGSVALLLANPSEPHRLLDPLQVFRRTRNGMPLDSTPPANHFALGDLDGDGSDEVVVTANGLGLAVVNNLAQLIESTTSFEKVGPANGYRYDAGPKPGAVAVIDVNADGKPDVVVLDDQEPVLRVYMNQGGADQLARVSQVQLPDPGVHVAGTGCPTAPMTVLTASGKLFTISHDNKLTPVASDFVPMKDLVGAPNALAVTSGALQGIALYDACATVPSIPNLSDKKVASLAINQTQLATLGSDATTVTLFGIE